MLGEDKSFAAGAADYPDDGLAIITSLGRSDDIERTLIAWEDGKGGKLKYYVGDAYEPGVVSDLLTDMVNSGPKAFPGADGPGFEPDKDQMQAMQVVSRMDLVVESRNGGWRFRQAAVAQLRLASSFGVPSRVCSVRTGIPEADRTVYELILQLEAKGFRWERLPTATTASRALPLYKPLDAAPHLVWYSSGLHPFREYLLCLRDAEQLLGQPATISEDGRHPTWETAGNLPSTSGG